MEIPLIMFIAVGLAMDAFAVSIAIGIRFGCPVTFPQTFRLAFTFGTFQFMMPIIGWYAGTGVGRFISGIDHWIAFGLLSYIGVRMIKESFEEERTFRSDPTRGLTLLSLAIATSMDSLAVGITIGLLQNGIIFSSVLIGLTAAAFTVAGLKLGCNLGMKFSRRMEVLGGSILILIGITILARQLL